MASLAWLTAASSFSTLLANTEKLEEDAEEDAEGDAGEEDDSGDQGDEKPRLSKRQYSHMDDDEGMQPYSVIGETCSTN